MSASWAEPRFGEAPWLGPPVESTDADIRWAMERLLNLSPLQGASCASLVKAGAPREALANFTFHNCEFSFLLGQCSLYAANKLAFLPSSG